tara:strand:- start:408 stop:656 length:249 start_codon:yes stop_codon:yes gene_type:complete
MIPVLNAKLLALLVISMGLLITPILIIVVMGVVHRHPVKKIATAMLMELYTVFVTENIPRFGPQIMGVLENVRAKKAKEPAV